MSLENPTFEFEKESQSKVELEPGYEDFVPEEFKQNPVGYFEFQEKNIKSGEIKRDETGKVLEDPTAVKELPTWTNANGQELQVIGKKVNIEKGETSESSDPFYEYRIMKIVNEIGLPVSKPVAKAEQQGAHLIIMEKIAGTNWYEKGALKLREKGYNDEDIENLKEQAEAMIEKLKQRFEEAGVIRGWKLKDMIFDIDIENKRIKTIIPTDWERTKIDTERLERYKKKIQSEEFIKK